MAQGNRPTAPRGHWSGRDTRVAPALPRSPSRAPSLEDMADAWSALRGHPARFLGSSWPWRALAYLVTSAAGRDPAPGGCCSAWSGSFGVLERRRLGLVQDRPPSGLTWRERRRARRRLPVSWPEVGYAFLLAVVLWPLDFLLVAFAVSLPVLMLWPRGSPTVDDHEHGRLARSTRVPRPGSRRSSEWSRSRRSRRTSSRWRPRPRRRWPGMLLDPREAELAADGRRPAPLARGPGRRLRDRAAPDRAGPARRRPAAAGRPHHDAGPRGARRPRRARAWSPCRTRTARPRRRWPSCAAPSAASTRASWSTTGSPRRCTSWPTAPRCRPPSTSGCPTGCRRRSSRRRTSSSARR